LGCSGEGKLQSLIAVFQNGKIFGIADFSGESVCSIAINEPQSLSAAIRKMKFLKASINAEYPLSKVFVYAATPVTSETSSGDVLGMEQKERIPLFITVIASNGDLLVGPIGTTSELQIKSIPNIQGFLDASSPVYKMKCIDVALLDPSILGPSSSSPTPKSCTGIALFCGGLLALVDLSTGSILRVLRTNLPSASRISLVSSHGSSSIENRPSASELEWQAMVVGIETEGKMIGPTNLFVLIHKPSCHGKSAVLQLGCRHTSTPCIDSSSPATDTIFCKRLTESGGSDSIIIGRNIADTVWSMVSSVLRGLNDDVTPVLPSSGDSSETSLTFLVGRILNLKITAEECEGSLSCGKESPINPFGVEELLDLSLEMMTSLRSSGEINTLLKAHFLCVSDPPDMFLDRALRAATVSMIDMFLDSGSLIIINSSPLLLSTIIDLS
jgi:hypothetical protein